LIVLSSSTFCSRVVRVIAWLLLLSKKRPTHWFVCLLCSVFKGLLFVAVATFISYQFDKVLSITFCKLAKFYFSFLFIDLKRSFH